MFLKACCREGVSEVPLIGKINNYRQSLFFRDGISQASLNRILQILLSMPVFREIARFFLFLLFAKMGYIFQQKKGRWG
jgi:hypothetical protein